MTAVETPSMLTVQVPGDDASPAADAAQGRLDGD